jgi:thioredoxin 1
MVLEVTDDNLSSVLTDNQITVLDFWAEWCGPCRMLSPIIDEVSEGLDSSISVGKVNVDVNPEAAAKYGIRSIPTVLFLKEGKVVDKFVGLQSKDQILERINNLM